MKITLILLLRRKSIKINLKKIIAKKAIFLAIGVKYSENKSILVTIFIISFKVLPNVRTNFAAS